MSVFLAAAGLMALLVCASPAAAQLADVEAEKAKVEERVIDLRRDQIDLEAQIKALQAQYAKQQLELDEHHAELELLATEARALRLEAKGEESRADFVRRGAELSAEKRALTQRSREASLRKQEILEPLKRDRDRLQLRMRELRNAEEHEAAEDIGRELRAIDNEAAKLRIEIKLEELEVAIEGARLYRRQTELRHEEALFFDQEDLAQRAEERIRDAIDRRRGLEVDLIFTEMEQELRVQRADISQALEARDLSAQEKAELSRRLRLVGDDFQRLGRARRTHKQEKDLGLFQKRLSRHFEDLEKAQNKASRSEAEALAEERERLREAVKALFDASAS